MRRIHVLALAALMLGTLIFTVNGPLAQNSAILSAPVLQTPGATTTLRRIQVNAKTITALPTDKKYVVDLTRRGVKYEFDAKPGVIDFSRVAVRTSKGEVAISSFLQRTIRKDKLSLFKDTSLSFTIGSRPAGTVQTQPSGLIHCGEHPEDDCFCTGEADCQVMLDKVCIDYICANSVPVYCQCGKHW